MFDWVPGQIWFLLLLGFFGFWPALFVFRYFQAKGQAREVGVPPPDDTFLDRQMFARSLAILVALVAVAIFSFTKAAEDFVRSPEFLPIVAAMMSVGSCYWTIDGFVKGEVEPLTRGSLGPYNRIEHPKRYWASMAWNIFVTVLISAVTIAAITET